MLKASLYFFWAVGILDILATKLSSNDFAVRFTLSFPFQTKEYNKVFIFLMNPFLFKMRITLYKMFGMARDLITWIFPSSVSPLQLQPFNNPLREFSIDSKFSL